jgi:hypothetical protein
MARENYEELNKSWKSTTGLIFGSEIGELDEFSDYLSEALVGKDVKSAVSGKSLHIATKHYCPDARFFDYETEIDAVSKELGKPVEPDKIKDIDSLFEAVGEKIAYCANKTLGNCAHVESSNDITDSSHVLKSANIIKSRRVAFCYMLYDNQDNFATTSSGESTNTIRSYYNNSIRRCFECVSCVALSDSLFCYNMMNSQDCMFSFNLRAKQYMIANVQLAKDQYVELKEKLVSEIRDELTARKRIDYSIIDILNGWKHE